MTHSAPIAGQPATASEPARHSGSLFIVVAPSGAGKTSLVKALLSQHGSLQLSISCTTRAPRPGEVDGQDYFFIERDEFERRRDAGEFLEWAEVHGNLYGTSRAWIAQKMLDGDDILLEIDWQGAVQVKQQLADAVGIFIAPPSIDELRMRLKRRGQDSDAVIEQRVHAAAKELQQADRFEYVIINQDFASALRDLNAIVEASRTRFRQQHARHQALFQRLGVPDRSIESR
ncbi:MAG: guanylate kinase [Burkholderiaceae bacterium]